MYIEETYAQYDHSIGAYCKLSTRSRCRLDYRQISSQHVQTPPSFSPDIGRTAYMLGIVVTVVKVLWYKSDGRWFDPSWCQCIFH